MALAEVGNTLIVTTKNNKVYFNRLPNITNWDELEKLKELHDLGNAQWQVETQLGPIYGKHLAKPFSALHTLYFPRSKEFDQIKISTPEFIRSYLLRCFQPYISSYFRESSTYDWSFNIHTGFNKEPQIEAEIGVEVAFGIPSLLRVKDLRLRGHCI